MSGKRRRNALGDARREIARLSGHQRKLYRMQAELEETRRAASNWERSAAELAVDLGAALREIASLRAALAAATPPAGEG
ncbi:MAG TPA: hypothetical protein PK948_06660 [Gemmatimonadales bacterium]|nr:hypothetical protein [Gemmatimonadales bacterium]